MRLIPILKLCIFLTIHLQAQQIDRLQSDAEVLAFAEGISGYSRLFSFTASRPNEILPRLSKRVQQFVFPAYAKADFDGNGYTDLLFNGFIRPEQVVSMVVMDMGNGRFETIDFATDRTYHFGARVLNAGGVPFLETLKVYTDYDSAGEVQTIERFDTLEYKFGAFIERAVPENYTLQQLNYACGFTLGGATFSMTICGDSALLITQGSVIHNNTPEDSTGAFVTRLTPETKNRITGLISNIHLPKMKDAYRAAGTCHGETSFKVIYNNGQLKKITDCGVTGPYGLEALENAIWNLYRSQQWTRITGATPLFECDASTTSNRQSPYR
ncbi:hypothetical protein [Paraflavitalea sp. CAU 1676]|uniref:DUF6438 domain-containing protein n=1 Tax=Paraflavitalea sp. CAU 1676 TaxID=3032598 RepID=UPI0023DA2ED6|nr:hypothetical protein [Paraflavitalea sp. CAU 1676]MDF2189108.1 hypothetical protein [Paraflavitalea sp. CAU 1676]